MLLEQLKTRLPGIEAPPGDKAQHERDERREERDPARVALRRFRLARQQEDKERADDRQQQEAGEDPGHQRAPPKRYQVASAATPSSIAKAYW